MGRHEKGYERVEVKIEMKIALLYPAVTNDGFAVNDIRPKTAWMHHGLCYISAVLKKEGHSVSLIDLRQLFGWHELPGIIKSIKPEVVGITIMSLDFDAAVRSAKIIKETDKNIKVVAGGVHPSLMESELADNPDIDYIFKGEAEITFPKVLEDMAGGRLPTKVITGERPDLDTIPFVDRFLFKTIEAPVVPYLKMPFITATAGRGCMYNCNFCQPAERSIFGSKVRRLSVERFMEELTLTKDSIGLNSLMIHDDCLVEDVKWVERFLHLYTKDGFRKPFVCQARADIIVKNPGLFKDMKRSGLAMLLIGFESGSQRMLNFLRKGTTVEQNYKAAGICKRLGIRIFANFMLGMPTETREEVMETVNMIKTIKPYVPSPTFYTPTPGSDLFDYCIKHDLSLIDKHEDYKRNPTAPKIKGVDYEFLRKALEETVKLPLSVKAARKIDRLKLGRFNKKKIKNYKI
ncbi:MAG: B12-binding domain-containing radical SAM protein [Candidatus Omnitrophica bacterium]|nr:B12-binding domain-containing radical SAM protein [Candidatus Omnitrophota bacterium]